MNIDEAVLRAYVDGELSAIEQVKVEAAVANNEEVRKQVEALRASCLPYRAAFDALAAPEMPEALSQQLAALSAVASAEPANNSPKSRRHWLRNSAGIGVGLAASFIAGVWVRPALFLESQVDQDFGPWVQAIASYQGLYVRETLERNADSPEGVSKVLQGFRRRAEVDFAQQQVNTSKAASPPALQTRLAVPDLSSVGLAFKRAQLLGFGESPLIQMAYLPAQGKPAALCVLPVAKRVNSLPSGRRMENLSVVAWQKEGLSYVLAVDTPLELAISIAKQINSEQYPVLFKTS
jgi:hypothetical protein